MKPTPFSQEDFLALDFDGVIADSIAECLIVGHNAFVEFSGRGEKTESLSDLHKNDTTEAKRLRRFIRSGEDYVYIQMILSEKAEINDQREFDEFLRKFAHLKEQFFNLFDRERERFAVEQTESWIRLNPLYKGMADYLTGYSRKDRLLIISTKKKTYIHRILKGHHIGFPKDHIFHAGKDRSKLNVILNLLQIYNVNPSQFHFIDDQVDTLIQIESSHVHRYLAEWGYNNQPQKDQAKMSGIPVLTLEHFLHSFNPG